MVHNEARNGPCSRGPLLTLQKVSPIVHIQEQAMAGPEEPMKLVNDKTTNPAKPVSRPRTAEVASAISKPPTLKHKARQPLFRLADSGKFVRSTHV